MTLNELKQQRKAAGATMRRLSDVVRAEGRDFTPDERREWDAADQEFRRAQTRIEVAERADEVGRELDGRRSRPPGTEDRTAGRQERGISAEERDADGALALQAWCRRSHGLPLTPAHVRACKRMRVNPNARGIDFVLPRRPGEFNQRSLSATTGVAGGYTVPTGFVRKLEVALKEYSGVRQVADVIRTTDGAPVPWPTANDTGNMGRRIGENSAIASKDPTFGQVIFNAYKYTSDLVLVPAELLEDNAVGMEDELGNMLGERIGRIQEQEFTLGTGNGMPLGVAVAAVQGKVASGSSSLTADDVIDLIHSVDPVYRRDPSFRLMFHDLTLAVLRKLKDSTGKYLIEEGQNGAPPKIKGVEYVINQNMPSTLQSGARSILAGPFKKYKVRDVNRIRFRRLDERYADNDQVGFIAFLRSDGKVLDAGTQPIKALVHP